MGAKTKGTAAERELVHWFWKNGWAASRVAGSGSIRYPVPDVLAGKQKRLLAIECKSTNADSQYLTKEEVADLRRFAEITGAEPYVAVRFSRKDWRLLSPDELDVTVTQFVVSRNLAFGHGRRLAEIIMPKSI